MKENNLSLHFETLQLHAGQPHGSPCLIRPIDHGAHSATNSSADTARRWEES